MLWVFVLLEFFYRKYLSLRFWFKPSKEECKSAIVEELVLCVATVHIHRVSNDREGDQWILQVFIVLIVTMREDKKFYELDKLELGFFAQIREKTRKFSLYKVVERRNNWGGTFLVFPLLVERLILGLEVESHRTEAGSLEVEIEVLVVLLVTLGRFLSFGQVFGSLLTGFGFL